MKKQKSIVNVIFVTIICVVLCLYVATIVFSLLWGLLTSFKSDLDFTRARNYWGLPAWGLSESEIKFGNYQIVVDNFTRLIGSLKASWRVNGVRVTHKSTNNLFTVLLNTILYAGVGACIFSLVPCVVGYMVAKYKFKFSGFIYSMCLAIMVIPSVGIYPAEIALLRNLGLYDTWIGYFIQKFNFTGMYFFVFFAFFQTLPNSFMEAAEVDGASQLRVLTSIIIPLAAKMLSTVILLNFIQLWNDYNVPLLYMPTKPTLAYAVFSFSRDYSNEYSVAPVKIAGSMFLAVPVLVIFICLKDKLMGNISLGGLKE